MGGGVLGGRRLKPQKIFLLISREWAKKISPAELPMKHYGHVLIHPIYSSIPKLIPFNLHVTLWSERRRRRQQIAQPEPVCVNRWKRDTWKRGFCFDLGEGGSWISACNLCCVCAVCDMNDILNDYSAQLISRREWLTVVSLLLSK